MPNNTTIEIEITSDDAFSITTTHGEKVVLPHSLMINALDLSMFISTLEVIRGRLINKVIDEAITAYRNGKK